MAKLIKIEKDLLNYFLVGVFILLIIFAFFFWIFMKEQRKTIEEHHIVYVRKTDATIATLLDQAKLNAYIVSTEIAELLGKIEDKEAEKEDLLKHLIYIEKREDTAGVLVDQDIVLVVDQKGYVLARSEWIRGKRVKGIGLPQNQHIKGGWNPSNGFEQAITHALEGETDVRKIIYDRDFLRREGYDHWGAEGMGLTVMIPIVNKESEEQKGVLISITFVNDNTPVVAGLKAVTNTSFTAILPSGEIIGSIFKADDAAKIEKISRSPELQTVARKRAAEKREMKRMGISVPDKDFILEEFTIEQIRLTHTDVAGGDTNYYRVLYWLELDHQGNFASLRGIAMNIDVYVAQKRILIYLIAGINVLLLIIFWFFYYLVQKKIVYPIISFTTQLKRHKGDEKIEIQKNYQELEELENAFNLSFDQAKEARDILELKVKARTRQLSELSRSLEEQVKEKTKILQTRVEELERFSDITIGREVKMIELKERIRELEEEIKRLKEEIVRLKNN